MATSYTELNYPNDILAWMIDPRWCLRTEVITNTLGQTEAITDIIGTPLVFSTTWNLADASEANTVDGIVVGCCDGSPNAFSLANSASTDGKYFILHRGPALVIQAALKTTDEEGDAITMADLITQLKTLQIDVVQAPASTVTSTQTY